MQYIEYARHCKANKRVEELLTRCLRMHPTKPELWVYGAKYALDTDGDMRAARGYMQRGLRFCDRSRMLWLEYGKLEMLYVAKLAGRRRILRLEGTNSTIEDKPIEDNEIDADTIALSALTAEDINPALAGGEDASEAALKNLASAPVLTGAIPMAVFNAAMQRFGDDLQLALQFFNTFADFKQVPSLETVLQHTIDVMSEISPMSMEFMSCVFRRPFILMASDSPEFPAALGQSIQYIDLAIEDRPGITKELVGLAITWLAPLYRKQELDESLKRVIGASLRQFTKALDQGQFVEIVKGLKSEKRVDDAKHLLKFGIKHFGSTEQLLQI